MQVSIIHATTVLRAHQKAPAQYEADFLVGTGATDTLAPGKELEKAGIGRRGRMTCELADGTKVEYDFGLAEIELNG